MGLACVETGSLLTRRRSGLSDAEQLRLESHLADCEACRFDERVLRALAAPSREPEPSVADAATRGALAAAPAPARIARRRSGGGRWALAAVAALAALAAAAGIATQLGDAPSVARGPKVRGRIQPGAPAVVTVAHARVRTTADTAARWDGHRLVLERGAVHVEVDPAARRPFRVETERFAVEVTGTVFEVDADRVHVTRGSVRVVSPEGAVLRERVGAGETWRPEPGAPAPAPSAAPEERPAADAEAAPTPAPRPRRVAPDPAAPAAPAPAAGPSARERFERAVRAEAVDPDAADRAYRRLEADGGPWAANALFARARLARARGRMPEARAALERYLAIYPAGINAEDARRLLRDER